MKKTLITTTLALSTLALAFAADATTTKPLPPRPLLKAAVQAEVRGEMKDMKAAGEMPVMTTGDVAIDAQVKALRVEMEAKLKALRDDYEARIKVLVGDRKPVMVNPDGSTTTPKEIRKDVRGEVKKEIKEERKEMKQEIFKDMRMKASTTKPLSALFDIFRGYFGASVQAEQK